MNWLSQELCPNLHLNSSHNFVILTIQWKCSANIPVTSVLWFTFDHYNITNSYFYLFCLCDWDCFFLDVLLSIHVSIFSTRSPYIVVHIFAFVFVISLSLSFYISLSSSIDLNRRLQWNLLCPHLHQESCLLVLIRLTKCFLQSKLISIYQLIWISNSISSSLL